MSAELIRVLAVSALASSGAIVVLLILRIWLRARFGARAAYAAWSLVPVAVAAALLPPPTVIRVLPVRAVNDALPALARAPLDAVQAVFDPLPWLAVLWLLGALLALLGALLQQRNFVRALGRLSVFDADAADASEIDAGLLRAESTAGCPALVGALRPRIVLPADFEQRYDRGERELILAHERAHRARGDAQANALAALLRCLFWFNPLVYFAASRFRFDQELACDALVIARFPEARRRYADAMLKTQLTVPGLPAGCHWQSCHPLKERIAMLKQPLPGRARALCGAAVAGGLVLAGSFCAWAAQPPNVVSKSGALPIRGDIALRIDGGAEHRLTIVTPPGVEFAVADGPQENPWELRATATPRDDGTIEMVGTVYHQGNVVGAPRVVVSDGISAGIRVDDDAARGAHLEASFVLTRVAHDARQPPATPPTENTSFRQMQPPAYPRAAIDAHQSGHIMLRVHVDEQGMPRAAQIAEAEPVEAGPAFSAASIAAAMQWRYNPGTIDGRPAAGDVAVPIDFTLTDD